ncbi:MAG: ABC transporter permease, partial [Kiritimatiellae bacterium]|nr:ABC transporter permease [Kiritimatiellia bacterium]
MLTVAFAGDWVLGTELPSGPQAVAQAETQGAVAAVTLDGRTLGKWDTSLLLVVNALSVWCRGKGLPLSSESMPEGVAVLIQLASAVPERTGARRRGVRAALHARVGKRVLAVLADSRFALAFVGETALSLGRFCAGRARFRRPDFWFTLQQCGPQALGIVTTISVLVGMILAFVGAINLRMLGVELYVADLVGVGMVIEMGALMTGIILAGRTGAAFAAQLGTMQVNE